MNTNLGNRAVSNSAVGSSLEGGTSLKPPFEWLDRKICNEGLVPDAMIYMTDGYGDFPEESLVPTLWVVPDTGLDSEEFPFGEVFRFQIFEMRFVTILKT